MRCPQCQQDNPAGARFCNGCGARVELACPACNHVNAPGSRFCNSCGTKPGDPARAAPLAGAWSCWRRTGLRSSGIPVSLSG